MTFAVQGHKLKCDITGGAKSTLRVLSPVF